MRPGLYILRKERKEMNKMVLRYNSEYDDLAPVMAVSETDAEAAFRSYVKERAVALLDISEEDAERLLENGGNAEEGLTYCKETGAATILCRNGEAEVLRLADIPDGSRYLKKDGLGVDAMETADKLIKEYAGQFCLKTPEEVIAGRDENNMVRGYVCILLSDVIDNDFEGFLDILSENLIGSDLLGGIDYSIAGIDRYEPNTLYFEVTGDVSAALETEEDEETAMRYWSYEVRDKESDTVLFTDSEFETENDAECQADMEAKERNIKNYYIHTFQPPYK